MNQIPRLFVCLVLSLTLAALTVACGRSETEKPASVSSASPQSQPAPSKPAMPAMPKAESAAPAAPSGMQQLSADATQCLDLVKQKRYAEAIDPCQRAVATSASTDVQSAYQEAKAAVAQEAQAAATKAATGAIESKTSGAAAEAAKGALGKLPGE